MAKGLGQEPDPAVAAALRENAFVFSGFKTHAELEQVANLITDENGNIRPFDDFRKDVMELNDKYNHRYLRTEYNQAVQAAQMASKWADFERDKELINLQYRTANDERVRASHRVLHGVTLPVDDKFWLQYTPPNGWGCRCTVVAVPKDDPDYPVRDAQGSTIDGKEVFPSPAYEIFKTNTAKDKKLFPDKHPYLPKLDKCKTCKLGKNIGLSATGNEWCQTCGALKECQEKYGKIDWGQYKKNKEDYQKYKNNPDYYDVEFNEENGGLMATHTDHIVHDAPNEPTFFGNMTTTMLEKECQSELFRLGNKAILEKEKEKNANGDTLTALDLTLNKERVDIASITGNGYYGWQMYGKNDQLIRWNNRDDVTEPASSLILYFHNPESFSDEKMQMSIPFFKKQLEDNGFEQVLTKVYCVIKGNSKIIEYDI